MRHLGVQTTSFRDIVDGKTVKDFSETDIPAATRYGRRRCRDHLETQNAVIDKLQDKAAHIYEKIDRPLMPILADMERIGILINADELRALRRHKTADGKTGSKSHDIAGEVFNLNSPRQLETLLFDKFNATRCTRRHKATARSTDERTLESYPMTYRWQRRFWNTARWPNWSAPTPKNCRVWRIRKRVAYTPTLIKVRSSPDD